MLKLHPGREDFLALSVYLPPLTALRVAAGRLRFGRVSCCVWTCGQERHRVQLRRARRLLALLRLTEAVQAQAAATRAPV